MKSLLRLIFVQVAILVIALFSLNAQHVTIPELNLSFNSEALELSKDAEKYIQSVVDIMKKDALHRRKLNFDHIHQAIRYYANGAKSVEDTHEGIKKVIPLLQDHHSYFMTSAYVSKSLGLDSAGIEAIKNGTAPHINPEEVEGLRRRLKYAQGKLLDGNIGYLSVPSFGNLYHEAMSMFADSLQRIIQAFDQQDLAGWVIDLRDNGGGADMPMITGLGPLLDSNNVYYSVDEAGYEKGRSYFLDGGYYSMDQGEETEAPLVQSTVNYQMSDPGLPVAILVGFKTASSAEAVTTIFSGQPNVKIIGSRTNGLTTVNDFNFLDDNSVLNLTIGYFANRYRQVFTQGIDPDLVVNSKNTSGKGDDDVVLGKAVEWIMKKND